MTAFALFCWSFAALTAPGAEAVSAELPPPAGRQIDFRREIRPILENTCLRCHGPEKPKSRFRLDNRESALKGGDLNTDDIVPGDSAHSRLVHYVARVVEDMEMPPPGKGEPLTAEQVGILRAWIDQGAPWDAEPAAQSTFAFTPTLRWIGVKGDAAKFRELEGVKEGWGGGAQYFSLEQRDSPDRKTVIEGRLLWPDDDQQLKLSWTKTEFGFVRAGFERWRRYYDDTGGYYPSFTPPSFDLGRDLHLEIGRAWMDFGLTLPDWPQLVFGYEYQFKDGAKSMLEWGSVLQGAELRNIYPAAKELNERVQILKFDVTHELYGWQLENRARVQFYDNETRDQQVSFASGPVPSAIVRTRTDDSNVSGKDTVRLQKQITDWWFGSGGYLYSRLDGDSSLDQSTVDAVNAPVFGNLWNNQVTLKRETHAFNVASLVVPVDGLSLSAGVQSEFTRQEGFGDVNLDFGDLTPPGQVTAQPGTVRSDLDETRISENALLRFTKIPFTVLFAEGRLVQDRISQFEEEAGSTPDVFLRDTAFENDLRDLRAGFSASPWRWISFNAHYRRRDSDSDYDHRRDESPAAGLGYSAFIRHREIATDEVEGKLVLHPVTWLKTTLTYRRTASDFHTTTDPVQDPFYGNVSPGGRVYAGDYRANIYGLSATFIPSPRLLFSGAFTWSENRTISAQNDVPYVVPYRGDIYSVLASANYALNPRTSLQTTWSFSQAGYGQNNPGGLPLGLDYTRHVLTAGITRKLSNHATGSLGYSYFDYNERNTGGLNDFTGHGVFATLALKWP